MEDRFRKKIILKFKARYCSLSAYDSKSHHFQALMLKIETKVWMRSDFYLNINLSGGPRHPTLYIDFPLIHDWKTAALDPGAWYNTVQEGGCRFMAAWVREEERRGRGGQG